MINLVIADDHPVVREGLRAMFEAESDVKVVREISQGSEIFDVATQLWPKFNVLVLDARMPDFDPIVTVRNISQFDNTIKIMILSSYDNSEYVLGLLNAGTRGYALKDEPRATLISAIRIIADGETYMSPKIASVYIRQQRRLMEDRDRLLDLTGREQEVLSMVGIGLDNQQISDRLNISYETVKNHLRNIYSKLGLTNRYQAIVFAFRSGLAKVE